MPSYPGLKCATFEITEVATVAGGSIQRLSMLRDGYVKMDGVELTRIGDAIELYKPEGEPSRFRRVVSSGARPYLDLIVGNS